MKKKSILYLTVLSLALLSAPYTYAQSSSRKIEVGAQFSVVKVSGDQEGEVNRLTNIDDTLAGGHKAWLQSW
jgi:hypothetical protein